MAPEPTSALSPHVPNCLEFRPSARAYCLTWLSYSEGFVALLANLTVAAHYRLFCNDPMVHSRAAGLMEGY